MDGATILGSDASAPYGLSWTLPKGGVHLLTAVGTDSAGGSGSSAPITVIVYQSASLEFQQTEGQLQLSWPLDAGPYSAETTLTPSPPVVWEPVTNAVSQVNGQYQILMESTEGQRYFRLWSSN